jgi:hypothetical protein
VINYAKFRNDHGAAEIVIGAKKFKCVGVSPPHDQNDLRTVLSDVEAPQGIKPGHMQYVLGISLALSVVAALVLWSFFNWLN